MNKAVIGTLAVVMLASSPARAGGGDSAREEAGPGVTGAPCESVWVTDPVVAGGLTGVIWGGPLVADDPDAIVSMRCSVQVGWGNDRHSGADVVSVGSGDAAGRAVVAPTPESFDPPADYPAFQCTEVTVDGATYYWEGGIVGAWSTSSSATCGPAIVPVGDVVDLLNRLCDVDLCVPPWIVGELLDEADLLLCPILSSLAPGAPGVVDVRPDGDVYVLGQWVWDCPPYGSAS